MNRVILMGRLGVDPELIYTKDGLAVCKFPLATSETYKSNKGDKKRTEWHQITVFGKFAETCNRFIQKGSQVLIEGRLEYRSWEDKNGSKHKSASVSASKVTFLDGKGETVYIDSATGEILDPEQPKAKADNFAPDDIPF